LSGEIRPVNRIEQRLGEAEKLGLEKFFISSFNKKAIDHKKFRIEIIEINRIPEIAKHLFG
jgi:DNA repair protein RadA/Sms